MVDILKEMVLLGIKVDNMKKKLLLMAGLISISLSAQSNPLVFPEGDVHASHTIGKVTISHDSDGYRIITETGSHLIASHNVDKSIRGLTTEQLSKALGKIHLMVKGDNENDLSIQMNVRGPGGGPLTGWFFGTKGASVGAGIGGLIGGPIGLAIGGVVGGVVGVVGGVLSPTP